MLLILRLAAISLGLSTLCIGVCLSQAVRVETDAYAAYRLREDGRRVVYVADPARHLTLDLMETHCFDQIPFWDLRLILPDHSSQPVLTLQADDPLATVQRLSCT